MKDKSSFIKTEVIISYFLLIFLAACAIFITYRGIEKWTIPDEEQSIHREKIQYVNDILTGLYDAEGYVGAMIIDTSEFSLYCKKTDLVKLKIDTLINLSYDNAVQASQLDTVLILLSQREQNLKNLTTLFKQSTIEELYRKNILYALKKKISKKHHKIEKRTIIKQDTILHTKPAKKKFFQRFPKIFSNSPDTTIEVRLSEHTIFDTTVNVYNQADLMDKIFMNAEQDIQTEKDSIEQSLFSEMNLLRKSNDLITLKMKNILRNFEKEEYDRSIFLFERREDAIAKVMKIIGVIGSIALSAIALFIFLIWRNISQNHLYRKQLEAANNTTQKLLEDREKLMLSITHDIKAPLSSVIGYIELLNNSKLTERQLHYLENMKSSSEHSLSLINGILDFNRLNSGKVQLNTLLFDEKKLFEDIFEVFLPLAQKKGLQLSFKHQNETDSKTIVGDPIRIRQIAYNLLSNAIKFTVKGEVNFNVKIVPQDASLCLLQIEVSDTGVGIDKADQSRIFQEYARVESDKQLTPEGFGLGLPIVLKLVEIQQGKITLSSEKGKGSSFIVTLPLLSGQKETALKIDLLNASPKILIIDDDQSQLTMVSEQLKNKGITATTCQNPYEALSIIEKECFDIIFTDIQMPGLNGFELIRYIRGATATPVIALSAHADINLSQFKEQGFYSFLSKPFTGSQLFSIISECLSISNNSNADKNLLTGDNRKNRFNALLSFAEGEKESEYAILQSFIDESKKNVENLLLFRRMEDIKGINQLAHKMLPMFSMMNEKELVEWLIALEKTKSLELINDESFIEKTEQIENIIKEGKEILEKR